MWTRRVMLLAALALLTAPAAHACSVVHAPFDQPTWEGDLRFVDGMDLIVVRNSVESVQASGFFLSYAPTDGRILVAGQDGLGADCSGENWLRLVDDGNVVWERSGSARVWPHADGPLVQHDGDLWRLEGENLARLDVNVPEDHWILGWSHDVQPVYRDQGGVVIGDRPLEGGIQYDEPVVAASAESTGVLFGGEGRAELHIIQESVQVLTWDADEPWNKGLAWAGGWYAVIDGQAFYIETDTVTELGVDAVSVGARGQDAIVFSEDRYTVFRDGQAVAAAARIGSTWFPTDPDADQSQVDSGSSSGSMGDPTGGSGSDSNPVPAAGPVVMISLALVATALLRTREGRL